MDAMICKMCNSNNIVRKGDVYVCGHCGTQYTLDAARSLVLSGSVQIDYSQELENLYHIARRARYSQNHEYAAKYYDMILMKDPQSWEANFFSVYFGAMSKKITELSLCATSIRYCVEPTLILIRDCTQGTDAQKVAIGEVHRHCRAVSKMLHLYQKADSETAAEDCTGLQDEFYSSLCSVFSNYGNVFSPYCIDLLKQRLKEGPPKEVAERYKEAIRKYEPNYGKTVAPARKKKKTFFEEFGCYIATAVYGSYDCPPVWTLRRFRDECLSETWYGRAFIRVYYALSPRMLRLFGKREGFRCFFRKRLDRLVSRLHARGYEDTPYDDPKY